MTNVLFGWSAFDLCVSIIEKMKDEECAIEKCQQQTTMATGVAQKKKSPLAFPLHPRIVLTGFTLTLITGLPNLSIASASPLAANIGIVSNALFGLGGVLGGCKRMWVYLLPGVILQLIALSYLCVSTAFDERYRDIRFDYFH